jgi:hypothetical protein
MSIIFCRLIDIGLITRIQKSIRLTWRFSQKRMSKIHGFFLFVEGMVKVASELVSSLLKGGMKVQPYA